MDECLMGNDDCLVRGLQPQIGEILRFERCMVSERSRSSTLEFI